MTNLMIEYFAPTALRPYPKNARTHSKKQVRQLAASIEEFGFTNPILIDDNDMILAGHGRVQAAKQLGLDQVPCVRLSSMTQAQKRAYVLAEELSSLLSEEVSFDLELTGFSFAEVDQLIDAKEPAEAGDPRDDRLPDSNVSARCKPGDLWQLGPHRLICGDATDPSVVHDLMDGALARMVFTDPPYNVPIEGHVSGMGKIHHREFAQGVGEMSAAQFTEFLTNALRNLANHSHDGSIHFVCMDWRHIGELQTAGLSVYDELKNLIVWVKDNGGMGAFYRSRHELIFAFKKGKAPHINTFELGQHGRYRTNVWQYKGVNTLKRGRMEELTLHPTVKPVQMIADAIKDVSGRGDIVLDLFGGSGSTLIAAQKTGRRAFLCELDPVYCDRIIARWEAYAKDEATQNACGFEPIRVQNLEAAE